MAKQNRWSHTELSHTSLKTEESPQYATRWVKA